MGKTCIYHNLITLFTVLAPVTKLINLVQRSVLYSSLFVYRLLIVRYLPCRLNELRQISD